MNKRWAVILAFLGVFVAGAVVGGLVARRSPQPAPSEQRRGPPPPPDLDRFTSAIMKRYTARLELDEAQRERLKKIVLQAEGELRQLRANSFQTTITIGDRMNAQVEGLLRPDQHERFEKLKKSVQNYWERERERRKGEHPRGEAERKSEKREEPKKADKRDETRKPEKEKR